MKSLSPYKNKEGEKIIMQDYDNNLSKWPISYTTEYVETKWGKTHIIISGDKDNPPLFLLHGGGSNGSTWHRYIEALSKKYRTYAIDSIGDFGKTYTYKKPSTVFHYSEWLSELMDNLKIDKAYMLGVAMGGYLAINMGLYLPDRLYGVAAIAPEGVTNPKITYLLKVLGIGLFFSEDKMDGYLQYLYGSKEQRPDDEFIQQILHFQKYCKPQTRLNPKKMSRQEVESITLPTLCVFGEKEVTIDPLRTKHILESANKNIKVTLVPGKANLLGQDIEKYITKFFNNLSVKSEQPDT